MSVLPRLPVCLSLFTPLLALLATSLCAQTPRDFAVDMNAAVSTNTPCISLAWTIRRQGNITAQKVHRRLKGENVWVKQADLATNQTSYVDNTAVPGVEYEYWMERTYTGIYPTTAQGYLSAGVNVPMTDSRGKLLLVIDNTMITPLAPEIAQLQADLAGDGWLVQNITATRTDTALNTRALIKAAYDADTNNVKMVYILGHVPVPYSGDIAPDGHGGHVGAWPADGYYGDMNGAWTDTSVNDSGAGDVRNRNIPGDGKFDQGSLPSWVELMVGRVDMSNMTRAPASSVSETSLLRRYLRKAHDFKFKQGAYAAIPRRSLVRDGFGYFGGENFAIAGWSWLFTGVGTTVDEPPSDQWFSPSYAGGKSYLVGCGTGGGSFTTCSSVGCSEDFGLKTSRVVFTTLFGSYFGDWDSANNFMRAPLAGNATGDSLGLTCFWGGRPNRVTHQMGMGETAGYCMWASHNSAFAGGGSYTPNIYSGVHCGLVGDPTLRLHAVEPPRNLSASSANTQIALAWTASTESNLIGYLVYRAATPAGPFARLTASPQAATAYTDATVIASQSYTYLVRTLKLETSPGGTYQNPSVGSLVTLTANGGGASAPLNPSSLTVSQNNATNALLAWVDNASSETGFRIERKTNATGSFASVGSVGANVTNFTDSGVFTQGNVYFYRVVATGSSGDSLPSNEASFEAFAGFFDLPVTRVKVSKTVGTVPITVNRFGGVTGPVTVNFATANSSAIAGTHFTATNGVLAWADGETGAKTISVPVINTATPQAARQFKVTLSSPSAGTALTINSSIAVLIEDPTATLAAPWSQTILNGSITDSSAATLINGEFGSVTIGGVGVASTSTYEAGRFIYQSHAGDGVMTAYFPAGIPSDGNARVALMARASTANNAVMAAAATSAGSALGSLLSTRTTAGGSATVLPGTANNLTLARWMRLSRASGVFSAETSTDGATWTVLGSATVTNNTTLWGIFDFSTDWSVTGLGNYHLSLAQNVTLTDLPPPAAPTGLTASRASSTSVSLQWNSSSFASGYRVERMAESGSFAPIASLASAASTNQTYLNTGLAVNTAYAFRVVATNAVGESAPSAPVYFATADDMLVTLTADDLNGADATVQRDAPNTPLGTQTNLSLVYYDYSTWQVASNAAKAYLRFNLAGISAASSATLKLAFLGVKEYDVVGSTAMQVGLLGEGSDTWTENSITWSNAPQNNVTGYGFTGTVTSVGSYYDFADDLTPAGEVIPFTLDAATLIRNKGANELVTLGLYMSYSAYIDWASREHPDYAPPSLELITTTNIPTRASFLTAAPGNGWSIMLRWQDTAVSETGFTLERREGAGDFAVLQTLGSNTVSFWDTTTQPGLTYTYRVRSFNDNGFSDWTPEVTLTAATRENAVSTIWDGGGTDTLIGTLTNWDFDTLPVSDGTVTVTFGTGGSTATVNTNLSFSGIVLNRDAAFTLGDGGGTLTLGAGGLSVTLPTANARTHTLAASVALATNQTWAVHTNGANIATVNVLGNISGSGGLLKSGNGMLALATNNSYEGVTTVSNGLLAITHSGALGSTNGNTAVRCASGGFLQISGGIAVAEPLTLIGERPNYGSSLLNSGGSNVWSGPITRVGQTRLASNGGTTLAITGGMTGGGGLCVINSSGTIAFYGTPLNIGTDILYMDSGGITAVGVAGSTWGDTQVAGGTLKMEVANGLPSATIMKIGLSYSTGGTFDLNGFNQTIGQLRNETALTGTRTVTSASPAVLTVNQDANSGYDGRLTGALGLIKSGTGMLTLSNSLNTLSGNVTVQGGTLTVAPPSSLGNSTNITVDGGTLLLQTGNGITNTACLRIANGATVSIAAGLSETVGTLYLGGVRKGRGTWGATGSGADYIDDAYFSGGGVISVASGESTYWDAGGADTAFGTGGNWDLDVRPAFDGTATVTFGTGGAAASVDRPVSLNGLVVNRDANFTFASGGGTLTLGAGGLWAQAPGVAPRTYTLAAPAALSADQVWCVTNNGAGITALTVSGAVSDGASAFGITKSGNGLCTFAGSNSYDGATLIAGGGGLRITHGSGLGSTNGITTVASNAWLEIGGSLSVAEPLTLGASGPSGALRSTDGTNVWSGRITLSAASCAKVLSGSRLTLSGGVTGSASVCLSPEVGAELLLTGKPLSVGSSDTVSALGAGTVAFGVAGSTYGMLEVAGLTVRADLPAVLPAASILSLGKDDAPNGLFDLSGNSQTVAQLKSGTAAAGLRVVTSAAPARLTVNGNGSALYDGRLTGALELSYNGTAAAMTLTLNGSNTYSGATTVSGGTLQVALGSSLGNGARVTVAGGTLKLLTSSGLSDSAVLYVSDGGAKVDLAAGVVESVAALFLGGGRQEKGTWGSTASTADHKDDAHFAGSGMLSVQNGSSAQWDGGGATANVLTPENWDFDEPPLFDGTAYPTFGLAGSGAAVNTNIALLGLRFNRAADFTLASGGGALTLGAGGIWAQVPNASSNTYTLAADMVLAADQNWGVTNTGAGVTTLQASGRISDGASAFGIAKSGAGVLTLSGDNSFDGPVSVATGGVLRVAHANALGSTNGATTVMAGGWLEVTGGVTVAEALTISGDAAGGSVGTLRSAGGTNVWAGAITLGSLSRIKVAGAGRLTLTGGVTGSSSLHLTSDAGAALNISGQPLKVGGSSTLFAYGAGTVGLGSTGNTFGTLQVSGATVRMDAANALPAASTLSVGDTNSPNGTVDLNGCSQTVTQLKRGTSDAGSRLVTSAAPATLTVSGGATAYDGVLAGALSLVKIGSSTQYLSNTNTYTGATVVSNGTLQLSAGASLRGSTDITVAGGILSVQNNTDALADAAVLRIADGGAKVSLKAGVVETVGALFVGGSRKGQGTWGGTGSGADTIDSAHFTGTGVIYVPTGTSTTWDAGGLNTYVNTANNWDYDKNPAFDGSAYLTFGLSGVTATVNTNVSFLGLCLNRDADFTLADGGGTLTLGSSGLFASVPNATSHVYAVTANLALATNQTWCVTNNGAGVTALLVSGAISDGASTCGITKSGDGVLTLSGDNSFDGPTLVSTGCVLRVAHANALGSTNGATTVMAGGWLEITGGVTVAEALTISGDAAGGSVGTLRSSGGTNVWAGAITLGSLSRIKVAGAGRLTLTGGVTGSSSLHLTSDAGAALNISGQPLKVGGSSTLFAYGAGTVGLGSTGNTFGTLQVSGATVRMDAANALPAASTLSVGDTNSPNGTVDLNGCSQTVTQLKRGTSDAGSRLVTSAAPATLTVSGGATAYDGVLAGALSLVKIGSSTQYLSNTNTYTGTTVVSNGTLQLSAGASLRGSKGITVAGGTLSVQSTTDALADAAVLRIADGGAKVNLKAGVVETVGVLYLGSKRQRRGTYGAANSGATTIDTTHFTAGTTPGVIRVLHGPESILLIK